MYSAFRLLYYFNLCIMGKIIKKVTSFKVSFIKLWKKINLFVGYTVAALFATVFLLYWPFDKFCFVLSLIWAISFFRLGGANVPIKRKSVVIMWGILCFGLSGIIMQILKIYDYSALGVLTAGIFMIYLYVYAPSVSYKLKYNDCELGWNCSDKGCVKTKYNGYFVSMCILGITMISSGIADSNIKAEKKEQQLILQLEQKPFVPVKLIKQEMYDGYTIYILEADGQRFAISPFDYPDVRNINSNSQVKVIFGNYDRFHLKTVKKIRFKN